jgi:hypothetical protein
VSTEWNTTPAEKLAGRVVRLQLDLNESQAQSRLWEEIAAERGTRMDEIQARAEAAEAEVARLRDGLRMLRSEEWTRVRASLIAVKGHLDTPYPDDSRWTPWTRFVELPLQRMDEAVRALLAEYEQPTDADLEHGQEVAKRLGLAEDGAA